MNNLDDFEKAMEDYTWIDIPTMYNLSEEQYKDFIKWTFLVDHHETLRLQRGGDGAPPVATTLEQLDLMISYLKSLREQMTPKSSTK